jgi:hypothetical protein
VPTIAGITAWAPLDNPPNTGVECGEEECLDRRMGQDLLAEESGPGAVELIAQLLVRAEENLSTERMEDILIRYFP